MSHNAWVVTCLTPSGYCTRRREHELEGPARQDAASHSSVHEHSVNVAYRKGLPDA
jgi:hypothetical protein